MYGGINESIYFALSEKIIIFLEGGNEMAKIIKDGSFYDTYDAVLKHLGNREKHLLLGNGFSIAYDPQIFSYNALKESLEKDNNSEITKLFEITKTSNFEIVMKNLDIFSSFAEEFKLPDIVKVKSRELRENLKRKLIEAIDQMHPECVFNLTDENINNCGTFLEPYIQNNNSIISTNYDLLLYWVLMRYKAEEYLSDARPFCDGFSYPYEKDMGNDDFVRSDYSLIWNGKGKQNIFYLHGALHIFDNGYAYEKEQYNKNNGTYIKEQIDERIRKGNYPVFVTAGDAQQKKNQIIHNGYLSNCYNHLKRIKGSLITLGFSFGENDTHIIDALNEAARGDIQGRLNSIYIGIFSESDKERIEELINEKMFYFKVNTFDAKSVKIW